MSGAFQKGDYFKLIVIGKKADGTEKQVEYYLADYRAEKEADRYIVDTWQWVDLSSLGEVKSVSFKMEGTKKNNYGLTTPTYFASTTLMVYATKRWVLLLQHRTNP